MTIPICPYTILTIYSRFDKKAIAAQLELIPNTLQSIKGIGPVYSASIIAEMRDINRFPNQAALAKYAGLAWNKHQHKRALALTARKFVRLVFTLLKENRLYIPSEQR